MEFRRIHDLPPYVFATVDQLKRELRRDGRDVIDLGFGNPDIPSPPIAVEKLRRGRAASRSNHRYSASRGLPQPARRRSASATSRSSASQLDPDLHVVSTIGAKEGLAHLMWVLLEAGRQRRRAEPRATRSTSSRRASPARPSCTRGSRTATCSAAIEEALERCRARAARRDRRRSRTTRRRRSPRPS